MYKHPTTSNVDMFIKELSICLTDLGYRSSTFYIIEQFKNNSSPIDIQLQKDLGICCHLVVPFFLLQIQQA